MKLSEGHQNNNKYHFGDSNVVFGHLKNYFKILMGGLELWFKW
jgi:hypothetical protein